MAPSEEKVKKSKTDKLKGEKVRCSKVAALVERSVQAALALTQPRIGAGALRCVRALARCPAVAAGCAGGAASRRRSQR